MPNALSYFATNTTGPIDLDALFAFHSDRFAGWKMEHEETEESTEVEETEEVEDETEEVEEPKPEDELPEWAREKLTKANAEAANYRTKLREAEKKLADAKTPEELEAAREEIRTESEQRERSLLIENVALLHRLPKELAERLRGETREELEADAKALAKFADIDQDPGDLEGGLTPRDTDTESNDPGELARKYGRGRRHYTGK